MTMKSVGFMLRTDGKASVKNDFAEVKQSGVDAFNDIADAAEASSTKAGAAADQFTQRQIDAFKKQANAAKLAAAVAYNQESFNQAATQPSGFGKYATVNFDRSTGSAKASAAVFAEQARQEEEVAAALLKIRAALDPVMVAQARYDAELKQYGTLLAAGHLGEEEHAAAVALSTRRLNDAKRALDDHSNSLGLNRMQFVIGASAVHRFADSIMAGTPPMRAFMMQAGDLATVLQMDDGGVAGGLAKVRSLITPTSLAIGAAAAATALGAAAYVSYTNAIDKLTAAAQGSGLVLGLNGHQLEAAAEAAASGANITVAAAREIETSYLGVAKNGQVLEGLTALTKDYAAATGKDMKAAAIDLAQMFGDSAAGAQAVAEKYGVLSQAQVDHITKLVEEGNAVGAQSALLKALEVAFDGAAEHGNILARSWDGIASAASQAWTFMGKALDRMAGGGAIADRIKDLAARRDAGPTIGQMLTGFDSKAYYQKQIDDLLAAQRKEEAKANAAKVNAAQALGQKSYAQYSGDQRDTYRAEKATINAALATNLPAGARAKLTEELAAYDHALTSFMPKQEKAIKLAEIDAQIAATKVPSEKAALAAKREQIAAAGEVITSADVTALAHSKADAAAAHATKTNDAHAKSLARQAQSMEVSASAAVAVAEAYLKGSAAGLLADARRKAATDATKKGIDVEEQYRRQLNLNAAEAADNGGKAIAMLRDETAARRLVNDKVAGGTLAVADMNRALSDENMLRPLIAWQMNAQGKTLETLTKVINEYRKALAQKNVEEARSGAVVATDAARQRTQEIEQQIRDLARSPLEQTTNAARRAAEQEAEDKKYTGKDRTDFVDAKVGEARMGYAQQKARYEIDTLRNQQDGLEYSQRELELIGKSELVRTIALDQLREEQNIRRNFPDMSKEDLEQRLALIKAQDIANNKTKVMSALLSEARQFGGQFVDDVLNPANWSSWGDMGKTVLRELETEFLKLALLNPIKNLINGNDALPTLGTAIKGIVKIFGHNATGTEHWSGGQTWVNENGPEIADLPNGTRIYPAAETRRMLASNDNRGSGHTIIVNAQDAVLAETVRGWVAEGMAIAAARGAAGGAALGQAEGTAASARRLGRQW